MIYGTEFAKKRYLRYENLQWKNHSPYKGLQIERCYDGMQPKACYRAIDHHGMNVIVGEGLAQVKAAVTKYILEASA